MTNMIKISKDFQTSVNIAYDLNDKKKIKNFITTTESLELFENIFLSTQNSSVNRANILIGAYGKGKSHIILEILSLLNKKDKTLFTNFLEKLKNSKPKLFEDVNQYLESDKKLLPVIISGSSQSLSQSFLYSLYQTLKQNEFASFMPDTNFDSAINTINKWKKEFPSTYKDFSNRINIKVSEYVEKLKNYDVAIYQNFLELYPLLTSGSEFNPFSGFDIVELYEKVNQKIIQSNSGYIGMIVIYDEFSKYLESSINKASINDIKLLQDFAEKCCRSGKNQMHLLLISHKEISNYIDVLPKEKVDGWKGVSERFNHIVIQSDYSQVYEIISSTIKKEKSLWDDFTKKYKENFSALFQHETFKTLFNLSDENEINLITTECFPLHPVTTYILPRLSEKVAQNERTMFTFLSSDTKNTLSSFVKKTKQSFTLLTPDFLFDYFENQFKSLSFTSNIKQVYSTTKQILINLENENSLEAKIVKTLCLIYALNQFERLSATQQTISDIFCDAGFNAKDVHKAIENLTQKLNFVYLRKSNNYLQLKESSKVNVLELINNTIEKRKNRFSEIEVLQKFTKEKYLYPVEYNTQKEMTRYFEFAFVKENDFMNAASLTDFENKTKADGIFLAILQENNEKENFEKLIQFIKEKSKIAKLSVFALCTREELSINDLQKLDAIEFLKTDAKDDKLLLDEFDLIEQDLIEEVHNFIYNYTHPETAKCTYISNGKEEKLFRKTSLTALLSDLCFKNYTKTPIINNEPLNKNILSSAAYKSREILLDAILNSQNSLLDITGGQELSFLRSSLIKTNILDTNSSTKYFNTSETPLETEFINLFNIIEEFIQKAKSEKVSFTKIVHETTNKYKKIGLRKGVLPIYVAVCFSKISNNIVIKNNGIETPLSAKSICNAIENPEDFTLEVLEWSNDKEIYIKKLEEKFSDYINSFDKKNTGYNYLLNAVLSWYRELPKYAKNLTSEVDKQHLQFIKLIKEETVGANELFFTKASSVFESEDFSNTVFYKISKFVDFYNSALKKLEEKLILLTKKLLGFEKTSDSLCNAGKKFISSLDTHIAEHCFENHAENLIKIFLTCGNDENKLVKSLAINLTGINTEDFSEKTISIYETQLKETLVTLKNYKSVNESDFKIEEKSSAVSKENLQNHNGAYFINFIDQNGNNTKRNFDKIALSLKGASLHKEIKNVLAEYAKSISQNEKRQVLLQIVEELSK